MELPGLRGLLAGQMVLVVLGVEVWVVAGGVLVGLHFVELVAKTRGVAVEPGRGHLSPEIGRPAVNAAAAAATEVHVVTAGEHLAAMAALVGAQAAVAMHARLQARGCGRR